VNEEELKKKGFNPEGLEVEEVGEDQIMNTFDKDYEGFISPSPPETQELISAFKYASRNKGSSPTTTSIDTKMRTPREANCAPTRSKSTR